METCKKNKIHPKSIDLIGSHGQTIRHDPAGKKLGSRKMLSTLQIGEPCVIAQRTGITTVADFRPADIAAGGQGAPLVPFVDFLMFSDKRKNRIVQNIGGIANATFLYAGKSPDKVIAFDTGPGNMVIDALMAIITGGKKHYDKDGKTAASGKVNRPLLAELMKYPYFRKSPPKSTGREMFGLQFAQALYITAKNRRITNADIIATATALTAKTVADAYKRFFTGHLDEVILCGGGARNKTLVSMIADFVSPSKTLITDSFGINADAKEAICFAVLAAYTILGKPNNLPSATGANKPAILGKIVKVQK